MNTRWNRWLPFAIVLAVGLWMRIVSLGAESYWLDELYGATYTNLPFWQVIVAVLRFDIHPPFYYLQLQAWSAFGHSDVWLSLNSVAWSTATIILVYFVTLRRFGYIAAIAAMAACAVMGGEIFYAHELRMYSMISTLAMLGWIAADRLLADYRFRTAIPLIALLAILSGVHSAALIPVSAVLVYASPIGRARPMAKDVRTWLCVCAIVGLTLMPWIINASLRSVSQTTGLSFASFTETLATWAVAPDASTRAYTPFVQASIKTIGVVAIALALIMAVRLAPKSVRFVGAFIAWPLLFAAAICIVKPIWYYRAFAFSGPFICVAIGVLFATGYERISQSTRRIAVGCLATTLTLCYTAGIYALTIIPRKTEYREAAMYVSENARPGDIVYAPEYASFWGIARYTVGPEWGNLLEVEDPLNPDRSKRWPKIYEKLGDVRLRQLHLLPRTRRLDGFKVPIFVGWTPLPEARSAKTVWLVAPEFPIFGPDDVDLCSPHDVKAIPFRAVTIFRVECRANGA